MSDLQRLRDVCCPDCVDGDSCSDCQAIHEAAAEIERLRGVADTLSSRATAAECALSHRIALRREIEAALGIQTDMTDDAALEAGLAAIRRLQAERAEARREVARLQRAEATFHVEYRQRCDAETKALHIEVERLRDRVFAVAGERDEARALLTRLRDWLAILEGPVEDIQVETHAEMLAVLDAALGGRDA